MTSDARSKMSAGSNISSLMIDNKANKIYDKNDLQPRNLTKAFQFISGHWGGAQPGRAGPVAHTARATRWTAPWAAPPGAARRRRWTTPATWTPASSPAPSPSAAAASALVCLLYLQPIHIPDYDEVITNILPKSIGEPVVSYGWIIVSIIRPFHLYISKP